MKLSGATASPEIGQAADVVPVARQQLALACEGWRHVVIARDLDRIAEATNHVRSQRGVHEASKETAPRQLNLRFQI